MELSYFDVVDDKDKLTGKKASYDIVHDKGLWYRGVHVIIYTPEKEIVMQKRSPSLKYHPNDIEISVGGGVDAGETPEQAAVREVQEELGLKLNKNDLSYIGKVKSNHKTKTQMNKVFIYSYSACVPKSDLNLNIVSEETSKVFLISHRKLRKALRVHRIKGIGKVLSTYAYWNYLLDSIPR
jgi:isopentenyl-diphosphate delta-isomerase